MTVVAARQACRRLAIVCLAATVLYIAAAAVVSIFPDVERVEGARFWPAVLPDWPVTLALALAGVFVAADALAWSLSRVAAGRERERLKARAADWRRRADAGVAMSGGAQELRLREFRAEARAGGVALHWAAPAGTFDRILILRSRVGFALAPAVGGHQAVAYEGEDSSFVDHALEPDRVYFYTAFALGRGQGESSPPAWSSVTTRPEPLGAALRRVWTLHG